MRIPEHRVNIEPPTERQFCIGFGLALVVYVVWRVVRFWHAFVQFYSIT